MLFRRLTLSALALLLTQALLAAPLAAATDLADWPECKNFAVTMSAARTQYAPISIAYYTGSEFYSAKETTYELEHLQLQIPCNNMRHFRVDKRSGDAAFKSMVLNLASAGYWKLIICDGRGNVLGLWFHEKIKGAIVASEADQRPPADKANTAWAVVNWEKSADEQLKSLETKIKLRQYADCDVLLKGIAAQDRKFTDQLAAAVPWSPADKRDPWFYAKEVKEAREKLKETVKKELEADQALLASGKLLETQKALKFITSYHGDEDLSKKIDDLNKQLILALQAARAAALSAAASATSAAPAAK
jgi:hypothetical protein